MGKLHLKTVKNESDMASAKGMSFLQLTLEDSFAHLQICRERVATFLSMGLLI